MATTLPRSSLPLAKNNKPILKASKCDHSMVHYSSGSSPNSHRSSACETPEDDADQEVIYYHRQDYNGYIRRELYNRVFVDFEVFMKSVLHTPDDWKDIWGLTIAVVKMNGNSMNCHTQYCQKCDQPSLHEKSFYTLFVDTMSAILDALSGSGC